jgi:hypothetical protein
MRFLRPLWVGSSNMSSMWANISAVRFWTTPVTSVSAEVPASALSLSTGKVRSASST